MMFFKVVGFHFSSHFLSKEDTVKKINMIESKKSDVVVQ